MYLYSNNLLSANRCKQVLFPEKVFPRTHALIGNSGNLGTGGGGYK